MIKLITKHKAYILMVYAFLLFIHFVLKDRIYPISILFYAFPLIIIIVLGVITSLLYLKRKVTCISLFLFQLILIFNWFSNYYAFAEVMPNIEKTSSTLFWNVAKKEKLPLEIIIKHIKNDNIKNIALVEAEHFSLEKISQLKNELPGFYFKRLKGNMIFGSKNKIIKEDYIKEDKSHRLNYIETLNPKGTIEKVLIVDIYANPFYNREQPLNTSFKFIKEKNIDIVVGDFNTPFESIHFVDYKSNLKSFHKLSKGPTATWAYGLPLLELDHIWINKKYIAFKLEKYNYSVSDHQLLIAKYLEN